MAIVFAKTLLLVFIRVEMLLMLTRAILSWLPIGRTGGAAFELIVMMTEPVIYPVRLIVDKFTKQGALPIDISFIAAYLLIYLLEIMISSI